LKLSAAISLSVINSSARYGAACLFGILIGHTENLRVEKARLIADQDRLEQHEKKST
jgi:hypothetical protein